MLMQRKLRWIGHVIRMQCKRLPRRILYGELLSRRRHFGCQRKRFSDNMMKQILKYCHTPQNSLRLSPQTGRFGVTPAIPAWRPSSQNTRVRQRTAVSDVINRPPSPSLVTVARTATGLVRRLSACTAIAVPTDNDYDICSAMKLGILEIDQMLNSMLSYANSVT